ncbi:hypothetical protein BS78_02G331200 [Paspalum vaginatum]|nr:hypothetical protein BS78_02G331200 [Paspalum vaginatum]
MVRILLPRLITDHHLANYLHLNQQRQMYVFGDSFADTGNVPKSALSRDSRQWYKPYGSASTSGRFSNRFVQSDFIATWLGHRGAPTAYRLRNKNSPCRFGMNFAVAGAGVLEVPQKVAKLSEQVDHFEELIDDGTIRDWRLHFGVALVAVSGNDYARLANMTSANETMALIDEVTTGIAHEVRRLHQDIGVPKILVNNLHPLGCTPFRTRPSNYTRCDDVANAVASTHNKLLTEKLGGFGGDDVMLLDLNAAFSNVVQPSPSKSDEDLEKTFKNKLRPGCESFDPEGYCGQEDGDGNPQYSVTNLNEDVFGNFYWDDVHPAHTGWYVVMMQLQKDIKAFLHI